MPAPATIDAFLEVLGKSGLVDPERLQLFLSQAGGLSEKPRKLAARMVASGLLTQFQAEQVLQGKHRGFTIGKYKVLERIGSGGHSMVYLCEHMTVKRRVAVKVLPSTKAENPAALARFYREARAAGALDHVNLVKAHDIDQDNGLHFLVMDYVDGSNLQEIISRFGPLPVERACHYIRQAAQGLQAAHVAGLVHRDIKPANILLDRQGVVRVLDLGLARFFSDHNDPLTLKYDHNNVLGTADYVAPEQALNSHDVDIRADIYGLGGTFYFLLAGQPLFPDGQITQKLIWHQTRQPKPIRALRPEVPKEVAAIVERMIDKDPDKRYQTPVAVIEALVPWTANPLLPPTEAEMPRLSPAARAAAVAEAESGSNLGCGGSAAGISPRSAASLELPPRPRSLANLATSVLTPPVGAPQRPRTMVELPTPPIVSGQTDTTSEGVAAVNASATAPSHSLIAAAAREHPAVAFKRRSYTALLFITTAALTGMGIRWFLNRPVEKAEIASSASPALIVSHAQGTFPSIAEALRKAPAGGRILVCEPTWEEVLRFSGDGLNARAVHIEGRSPTGAAVYWHPPRDHARDQPLVQLSEGANLTLKGFTLHGEDRVQDLVSLAGPSSGLTLEDMQLQGFQRSGVALHHCTGTDKLPVTLQRLRIVPVRAASSALSFEAGSGESNRHVRILDCRLEGPYQSAVELRGPAADIELKHNRIYRSADGVFYARTTPAAPLDLSLEANTFCAIEKLGLHFETLPPVDRGQIRLTNNLFAHTGTLARVDDFAPQPRQARSQWIWAAPALGHGLETAPMRGRAPVEKRYFRKDFRVAGPSVSHALLNITGDSAFTVWLNGVRVGNGELDALTQVGHGVFRTSTRRVFAFDVARFLRSGENVLAVEGSATTGTAGVLAELTYTCPGSSPVSLVSDATWRAFREVQSGWQQPGWKSAAGQAAVVVAPYGGGPAAWRDLAWDCVLREHFQGQADKLFPDPIGNVRDDKSAEGYPLFKALSHTFELPADANDDAQFLRYPATSLLKLAGAPGVPPIEKTPER
jgi:serine/threonine protein kinase